MWIEGLTKRERSLRIGISFASNFRFSFDICKFMVYLNKEMNRTNYSERHEYKNIREIRLFHLCQV
jgi:hypothetical protein